MRVREEEEGMRKWWRKRGREGGRERERIIGMEKKDWR